MLPADVPGAEVSSAGATPASPAARLTVVMPGAVVTGDDRVMSNGGASSRRSLSELYALHAPAATRLAYLLTGDGHLSEDLVQDAFVRAAGRFEHLRSSESFGPYLRRAVVNLSRGYFRRKRVERSFLARERARPPEITVPSSLEERDELWRALQHLPHRQRAAVVLRFYEDLSEHQAAEVLGCSQEALKSLVARAMRTLRTQMRGEGS